MVNMQTSLDMNSKARALTRLQEESKTICQAAKFLIAVYLCSGLFYLFILAAGIAFQGSIMRILEQENGLKGWPLMIYVLFQHTLKYDYAAGQPSLSAFALNLAGQIAVSGIGAYIFYCILKVFQSIQNGETPFTPRITGYWKRCYSIFAAIAMILFLASFILRGASILMFLFPLMFACFFYALSLIFEYGTCLQAESDETL
jgi:hypothetical protein